MNKYAHGLRTLVLTFLILSRNEIKKEQQDNGEISPSPIAAYKLEICATALRTPTTYHCSYNITDQAL